MIGRLSTVTDPDAHALASLLVEAVQSGAAVSFLASLTVPQAETWWRKTIDALHPRGAVLVARERGEVIGTVTVQPAWAPNQPHRADIVKLLVRRDAQGKGVGARLMQAAEDLARERGFTLLTLDARAGTTAERLYRRLGWTLLGTIPRYALDPDGTPHVGAFFHKQL